jgi:very-short-patch-repair endonuclease
MKRPRSCVEARVWAYLRRLNGQGRCFRRGAFYRSFRIDFVDHRAMLAIELADGEPGRRSPDTARRHVLAGAGYTVLRLWTRDIEANFLSAVIAIDRALDDAPPPECPSPE